jgi:hypothetical protein
MLFESMRKTLAALLSMWFLATASLAQEASIQHPPVSTLLANLHSEDSAIRSEALERLRSDPAMLHLPVVRSALFDLLDQNNKEVDQAMRKMEEQQRKHPVQSGGNGEDIAEDGDEFFSWLSDTAASVADWSDRRQVCILVDSAAVLDGPTTEETASRMKAAMPCILQRSRSEVNINRAIAAPMLVEALAKGKTALDPEITKQAQQLILSNLHDPDPGVRSFTVGGLYNFGEPDMIPALAAVAQSDPAIETQPDKTQWYPIRDFAAKAIAEIEKRAATRK